jgi:hypothetical protein
MALSSLDLELPLLLHLLLCFFGIEPYPLLRFPRRCSPSSIAAAQWLGPAVKSQNPGARPLLDRVVKRGNRRSTWLPQGLNSFGSVPEPYGPTSGDGSTNGGGSGAARVGEDGGGVSVRGASGPWGWPHGPMKMHAIR